MKRFVCLIGVVAVAFLFSAPAGATLIGDEVNARWQYPPGAFDENETFTVGAGAETTDWVGTQGILDLGADYIQITLSVSHWAAGIIWTFSDLDWAGEPMQIAAVTAIVDNWTGWNDSFISFTKDSITVTTGNIFQITDPDNSLRLNITTRQTEIPEPTTMALLGVGAAGLIARRRRIV